ncbi:MAG: putative concanavalin A-like lectin/glucanases superfamily protein [Prokaryotic dsDNA virus sp.]|nr:MAG: putative concanavalin A-like lectin/glucanases superfamily protein [Prokaryotic dsDNA virus sp.]|tara:strand:- start:26852 stop:29233 length:2382 start_codon:yes stop_codon:yes gene_type:complete
MALGKRLINTGGEAACLTETTDIFGDSSGKALYSMDFDASSQDGTVDATPTNVDFGVSGRTVNSARFNGSSSKIDLPDILPANSNADSSFTCWFRTSDTSGNQMTIVNAWNGSTTANNGGWALFKDAGNTFFFTQYYLKSSASGLTGGTAVGDGNWHFVAVVFDYSAGTLSLYLDGNSTPHLQHTSLTPGTVNIFNGGAELGYQKPGGPFRYWNGDIDQVRIFSKALSTSEISTLYNSGNGETACVHTATTDNNDFPVTNVAYYKLDNSAEDSKGTNDGTENNIEYRFGKYNQAAVFNGSSSYINLPNLGTDLSGSNTRTLSAWVNLDANPSVYYAVVSYGAAANLESFGLYISSSGTPRVSYYNLNWDTSTTLTLGNWHHIVGIYKGGNVETSTNTELYINGVKQTITKTGSLTGAINTSNSNYAIGYYRADSTNSFFDGKIDQVRIFSTDISQANVTSLFEEKPETDTSNFKTVLYEGTSANQYISNVGMDLETSGGLVWIKNRDVTDHHILYDTVRGATKMLLTSSANSQEFIDTATLTSFEKNGFFLGADGTTGGAANGNNESLVAWSWKGGGSPVTNTNGANITSSVSANTSSGFSIVSYTGTGNGNVTSDTVGHGLSSTPDIVIIKRRDGNDNWQIEANIGGTYKSGGFNTGTFTVSSVADPTSTTFNPYFSNDSGTYVAYCWHSVVGYSKIGTYTGDGTSSGTTINVGFKPSFLIVKNADTSATNWFLFDSRRDPSNPLDSYLIPNTNALEANFNSVNFNSTGFELLSNLAYLNQSSDTYLYMAFK